MRLPGISFILYGVDVSDRLKDPDQVVYKTNESTQRRAKQHTRALVMFVKDSPSPQYLFEVSESQSLAIREVPYYFGIRSISYAKPSREFFSRRGKDPIMFLNSTSYYLLKLSGIDVLA